MRNQKKWIGLCLSIAMMVGMLAACTPSEPATEDTQKAPNPYSSVAEVGTEAELTAVREKLIKATETKGLGEITKMEFYENGVRTTSDQYVQVKDNKKIYYAGDIKRVVNYPDGYMIDIPQDWVPDYSLSSKRVRYDSAQASLIASREEGAIDTFYGTAQHYLDSMYQFVDNVDYQRNNDVTVLEDRHIIEIGEGWSAQVYRLKLENCPDDVKDHYTYVDYFNDLNDAYHFMFKAVDDRDFADVYMSFKSFYDKGAAVDTVLYPCENNVHWAQETIEYYQAARKQTHVDWGLFSANLQTTGWKVTIPMLEKRLDYTFPIISEYRHFSANGKPHEFPLEFCQKVTANGDRMMQITYQYTDNNNMDLTGYSPSLDIYRRTDEAIETLTNFAKGAAELDQPFFFRLNNEMSTDWTSYSAVANMLDPDIFIETWITLYDLFTETGANEYAMWVFNSQDHSYPPLNWANYRCYMPQANYIDWIGLTAYNFGSDTNWNSYESLYEYVHGEYEPHFGDWPWIISEFGCSDESTLPENEGRRAQWVTDMFDVISQGKYPQIKVAVWFNANDYDTAGNVVHGIVLQTDPDVVTAFKEGLAATNPTSE